MNDLILELALQAGLGNHLWLDIPDSEDVKVVEQFAKLLVSNCLEQMMLECEDFENGNVFGGKGGEELWLSVTREYGKEKQRGFNPVGIAQHLSKVLKKNFNIEQ